MQRTSVLPVTARLVSPTSFVVWTATGDEPSTAARGSCEVRRAQVQVTTVQRDTLYFDALVGYTPRVRDATCAVVGPGFIVLAAHPDLQSEVVRRDKGKAVALALLSVPAVLGLGIAAILIAFLATYQ